MEKNNIVPMPVPVAVRVYPIASKNEKSGKARSSRRPDSMFVFDTETRTDSRQSLTFGSYRYYVGGQCLEEGLFYGDDLSMSERLMLEEYASSHEANTDECAGRTLKLWSQSEFLDRFYRAVYKGRVLCVGFNLPFDFSRIACEVTTARGRFAGGFSLELWSYTDENGISGAISIARAYV